MQSGHMSRKRALEILKLLARDYSEVGSELNHENTFQLLVATMLAAQDTDRKVNEVTKSLFEEYRSPDDFLKLSRDVLAQKISRIHYCRAKASNILSMCRTLVEKFGGEVPRTREELMELAGVGRKTANAILSYAYGIPAIAVDTHVHRVAQRLGLAKEREVQKTELVLQALIPEEWWIRAHNSMVLHGRRVCTARNPRCRQCGVAHLCAARQDLRRTESPVDNRQDG
ncbi:endonuclease III [Thermoclostridium caenicola]|uniref:Endonuclease III n=2 Tax=Thermoclostridium caenicola TaxID=659425 RepID=A0A1M6DG88_9FIRM|nr:endonuclease III [Thermoclostridium caenicola]SHI72133.1 DNA-(apurinic or apyrimidinic site) lyase /endonuclease III [Thermoclostridium caenicola]HOL84328.1 endonuclease III [Thermoclostridium caenicola]HPO76221.1 endonuclease III [Thermoclostridium caenicola]